MKKTFFYLFILTVLNVWSQTKHFDIKWRLNSLLKNQFVKPDEWVLFQSENYQYNPDNIIFSQVWQSPAMIEGKSVKLINVKSSPIDAGIIKKLKLKNLKDQFIPKLNTSYARNDIFATFEINTIIQKNGQYYKLDAFDVQYAYSSQSHRPHTQNIYDSRWASGKWYKFKIDKSGVYKLSKSFLKSLGLDVNNLDPRKLKIFGNGGKVMPLKNSTPYPEDITELAIEVVGEQDGSFDNDDYVLFYAQSDKEWSDEYDSNLNVYTNNTYYFVQIDNQDGKRMQPYQAPSGTPVESFEQYRARKFYERDKTIFTYMGRKVFDEPLDLNGNNSKTVQFDFDNRDASKPVYYKVKAATNKSGTSFQVSINGQTVGQTNLSFNGYNIGIDNSMAGFVNLANDPIKINISYQNNGFFDAHLYMEYINVKAYCFLTQSGKQFRFHHPDADTGSGVAVYHFTNAADITRIWDITDMYNPTYIHNSQTGFDIKFLKQDKKRFIAIDKNDYYTPEKVDNPLQTNQNLHRDLFYHTGQFQDLDYIIVTPSFLYNEAQKFADMHRQRGMNVYVAKLKQIYNEFGNSQQDIGAIRNMVKYVYNNASAPDKKLKFLMLFGDASNDYKNVISENLLSKGKNSNIVPIFESLNSFHLVESIGSDDFFAMMDDNEGLLQDTIEKPDIAVGRLLVRDAHEAEVIYHKYKHYLSEETKRNWRTFITLWSDDADPGHSGDTDFVTNTEAIAQNLKLTHPEFNVSKIYQDAYLQVNTPGGARYPDAKRDLFNRFETGTLILAYIGHGNQTTLSHERMLTMEDVKNLHNFDRLPLMTTMTCEFARFDDPTRETAAEHLIWNDKGGVLELVSTIREIWTSNAKNMNTDFYNAMFGMTNGHNGHIIRNPAEALRMAKIYTNSGIGKFNIAFLGDPGFELGFAKPKIVLNSINNKPTDTLKALKHMIVKGEIQDASGNLMSGFNGIINPIVFDKYQSDEVLDNDDNDYTLQFEKLGPKLFQGKADVVNGKFTFEFVVPKDIDLAYGKGRLSFYAGNGTEEKIGYDESIIVGGVDENAADDNKPPVIKAYMNDRNFVSGGITDANPYLLLDLSDENGINTIGGIGHDITAYLDDNQTEVYVLNDFYETETNTYQRGNVRYRLFDLKPGWHTLHVKAWDVYNNSGTVEINFQVVENTDIKLEHVLNYPNPFTDYTEFWFNHNHPFENLDVMVQVYTISGKLVWQHRQSVISDGFLSRDITWDGRDNFGNRLAKGVYVYKLSVKTASGKTAQKIEKLVIL